MKRRPGFVGANGGFALVLTVTLLALLVLLAVSLTSLARVDGTLAEAARHQAVARQDALLALDIAIARLQQFAGPDARMTAADDFLGPVSNRHYTGVWDGAAGSSPLTWLVSGNEGANPLAVTPVGQLENSVTLVGSDTVGTAQPADQVVVPLVDLTADDVPGQGEGVVIGRYAWWVGDQGIKASLALPDRSQDIRYAPFDSAEMLLRLRSQLARGPAWFSTNPPDGFDPESPTNVPLLGELVAPRQIAQLAPVGSAPLGDFIKSHFHQFTSAHSGVLANTRTDGFRGLKTDLSLEPDLLGPAFAAYAAYPAYMEPASIGGGAIPPINGDSSMRRRYRIQPPVVSAAADGAQIVFGVAPVLTEFLIQLSIQRAGPAVQVKSRIYAGLWNPYTSALVPEDLRLGINGLPAVAAADLNGAGSVTFDLQTVFGGAGGPPYVVGLPFSSNATNDTVSWLPGRLYTWTTRTGASPSADMHFYDKNISAVGWLATATIPGTAHLSVSAGSPTQLTVTLARKDGTILATCQSPTLPAFVVPDTMAASQNGWNFGFGFRLNQVSGQSVDRSWLVTAGADPRALSLPASDLVAFDPAKGLDPARYCNVPATAAGLDHFLIFRSMGGSSNVSVSANNDVPLFELPRQPVLNLAELQHLQIAGARPFALGNPWAPTTAGGDGGNAIFDRFFFSGLAPTGAHPDFSADEPMPNFHLQTVDTRTNPAAALALGDLQAAGGRSARFLLMRGAFNVNSTSAMVWQAELSALRFADTGWQRADIDNSATPSPTLGTQVAADPGVITETFLDAGLGTSGFAVFRFPQSAQETFSASPLANPNAPTRVPFRRGVRGGDAAGSNPGFAAAQIAALATTVASRVGEHLKAFGPFRSLEEFLSPSADCGGRSVLEDAIQAANLNAENVLPAANAATPSDTGFCSLTLTQADLLGILGPFLQTRSDTFLVRGYGESVNPATGRIAARAWCEATVQRLPATFDPEDDVVQPAGPFGRRFRLVMFRWLDASDI